MMVVWLSLAHYFNFVTGYIAYFFIIFKRIKISYMDVAFVIGLLSLALIRISVYDSITEIMNLRFFWGWVVFYYIFKDQVVRKKKLEGVFIFLCFISLVEAVLVNTIVDPTKLPHYPGGGWASNSHYAAPGEYQRPYSFGASASVSSTLIVVLMSVCKIRGWKFWLGVLTVLIYISGTGTIALLLLLLIKYKELIFKAVIPLVLILVVISIAYPDFLDYLIVRFESKMGFFRINMLFMDDKWPALEAVLEEMKPFMFFIGSERTLGWNYGGDFAVLSFFRYNGLFGLLLLIWIILSRMNRVNWLSLVIIVGSCVHFSSIFFLPGQMIFGLLLSINKNNFS